MNLNYNIDIIPKFISLSLWVRGIIIGLVSIILKELSGAGVSKNTSIEFLLSLRIGLGIISLIGVILSVFIIYNAWGMWKLKSASRSNAIAISLLFLVFYAGLSIKTGTFLLKGMIIEILIIYFLGFNKRVKELFVK